MAPKIAAVLVSVILAIGGFFFWIGGGVDLFRQPVEIVIPIGFSGTVCARLSSGGEPAQNTRYEVEPNGMLVIDEEIIRSHRKMRFLSRSQGNSPMAQLPDDAMFPIFSETDLPKNALYTVFWVGTPGSWSQFNASRPRTPLCNGSY